MFVVIETRQERRRPPKNTWIYKDPIFKDYDDSDLNPWKYELIGKQIPRVPKWKIIVKLRHTYRQAGKVKGKSSRIQTISFWDFIDSWIECRIDRDQMDEDDFYVSEEDFYLALDKLADTTGADGDPDILMSQLADKLRPFQLQALKEYKETDEYPHVRKHIDAWKELIRLRMETYYKQEEDKKRRREAEEEFHRQRARHNNERFKDGTGFLLDCSEDEKQIFNRIWKIGYRSLSLQLHPDKGGDPEQMKILNGLKDKLGK